ncbi:hypothetical protein [Amycolatopsis sp. NPDC059657]|uniref:hypothetical protein n=1 Tax=Amycolatopsis sp. NPDC059657 TaxID=3346899 RepID=UPI00366EF64C
MITKDMIADLVTMAHFNDLKSFSIDAFKGNTTLATWFVRITDSGYDPHRPVPMPSDFVLRTLDYGLVTSRMGREHLYKLKCKWSTHGRVDDHLFTGTVQSLPNGSRDGLIVSGRHSVVLQSRDSAGLRVGDRVRYTVGRDARDHAKVAHSVSKAT